MVKIVIGGGTSVSGQVGSFQNRVITDGGVFEAADCCAAILKSLGGNEIIGGVLDVRPDVNVRLLFRLAKLGYYKANGYLFKDHCTTSDG
jgi:hypothetical protein